MSAKVSVIIPTYNRAALLERAVMSVHDQTYRPIELIIINNASTDGTKQTIQSIASRMGSDVFEIVHLDQQKNDRNAARDRGIKTATGDYICFLDDDDEYLPAKLEKQARFLDQNNDVDIVFSNSLLEVNGGTRPFYPSLASHGLKDHTQEEVIRQLCDGNFIAITNVMIRAKVIKENPFDLELYSHEDYELWLRLAPRFRFDWIDEPLSLVHSHEHEKRYDMKQVRKDQINAILKHIDSYKICFETMFYKVVRLKRILAAEFNDIDYSRALGITLSKKLELFKTAEMSSKKGFTRLLSSYKISKMRKAIK